jgi:hypothetical protein
MFRAGKRDIPNRSGGKWLKTLDFSVSSVVRKVVIRIGLSVSGRLDWSPPVRR